MGWEWVELPGADPVTVPGQPYVCDNLELQVAPCPLKGEVCQVECLQVH